MTPDPGLKGLGEHFREENRLRPKDFTGVSDLAFRGRWQQRLAKPTGEGLLRSQVSNLQVSCSFSGAISDGGGILDAAELAQAEETKDLGVICVLLGSSA